MEQSAERLIEEMLARHRVELTGYCYRMLGSAFDAEDAVQDTMVRAWRAYDRFEGRASERSWLYRIATNVCVDMIGSRQRRARPMDLDAPGTADSPLGAPLVESAWIEPVPDDRVLLDHPDPAQRIASRQTIRLAFVAALQVLPAKQRAVLILREVLQFSAQEIAELLETSVASVNSALQRARATLDAKNPTEEEPWEPSDERHHALLARYVDIFERWDLDAFVSLLHEDATMSMPPFPLWLRGAGEIHRFWQGPASACAGSRLVVLSASGTAAVASYKRGADAFTAWGIHVLDFRGGRLVNHNSFLDCERLFPLFGLPLRQEL